MGDVQRRRAGRAVDRRPFESDGSDPPSESAGSASGTVAVPGPGPWLEESGFLADQLRDRARRTHGGSPAWLDPRAPEQPRKLGPHLYSGFTGIALFFSARTLCDGRESDRRIALGTLAPLRHQLGRLVESEDLARDRRFMLGALVGLGGYVYAFLRIGRWLEDEELVEEAHRISSLMTPERITDDERLDVAHGTAGALLALLALDRVLPGATASGATPLELATACGEHLLARSVRRDGGAVAWPANGEAPKTGFAHGALGIAYALLALGVRTGRQDFVDTARSGLDFERSLFDPKRGSWQVAPEIPRVWMNWCNGTAGAVLGRLAMLRLVDDSRIADEARTGLRTLRSAAPTPSEHLCCGNLGRAEAFREAFRLFGDSGFLADAESVAKAALARSRKRHGRYAWSERREAYGFDPSFFRGSAGAGYAALRCAEPSLPCVLRME